MEQSAEHRRTEESSRRARPAALTALAVVLLTVVPITVPLLVVRATRPDERPPLTITAPTSTSSPGPFDGTAADPSPQPSRTAGTTPAPTGTASVAPSPVPAGTTAAGRPAGPSVTPPAARVDPSRAGRELRPPPAAPAGTASPAPVPATPAPTASPAGPDLVVVSVSWSPTDPAPGAPVTFTAVVRNAGTQALADRSFGVGFYVDGENLVWSANRSASLAPGEQRSFTADGGRAAATWTATAGPHTVRAWVDDTARVPEADDANNTATATLTVA